MPLAPEVRFIVFSETATLKPLEKIHYPTLGPKAMASSVSRNKCAVPAVFGSQQANMGIVSQSGIGKAREGHEGIILGGHHERRQANILDDSQGAALGVVVGGVTVTTIGRGDYVIKLAQRAHLFHRVEIEFSGEKPRLSPHAIFQPLHKVSLVDEV